MAAAARSLPPPTAGASSSMIVAQHGLDRPRRGPPVVTALEHERQTALAQLLGEPHATQGHLREPGLRDGHPPERVIAVDVLAGGDEEGLRRELPDDRLEDDVEQAGVVAVHGARRERHVDGEALPRSLAALGEEAAAGVVRPLVRRAEEHPGLGVERGLRAVAVVDVPVEDGDALVPLLQEPRRGDGDVVEEAEAHRPVRGRVVSGRADERERHETVLPQVRGQQRAAGREKRRLVAVRRDVRVRVQPGALSLGGALDHREVARRVDQQHVVLGRGLGRGRDGQARPQVGTLEMFDQRRDPVRALRMRAGVVLGVGLVPDDGGVHAAKDTRERRRPATGAADG